MTADVGVHHDRLPPGKYYRWVGHRWVLKAWYDRANRIRYPGPVPCLGCPVAIFRDWAARDPLRCHPFAPRLLDHSTLAFEEYAYCGRGDPPRSARARKPQDVHHAPLPFGPVGSRRL